MNLRSLLLPALLLGATTMNAADPAIEATLRRAYDQVLKGSSAGFAACCHPEIRKYMGSFDERGGYTSGRSASLGELWNLAGMVADKETVRITNLKFEVVKVEGDKAIAWARYHAFTERPNSLEMAKGQRVKDEWDAKDYIILKKHNGEWRLRRLEDRAGHFLDLESQGPKHDPWGGVQ